MVEEMNMYDYTKKVKEVYPKPKEDLIDFQNCCKVKDYEVLLLTRCSAVFDKEEIKDHEKVKL